MGLVTTLQCRAKKEPGREKSSHQWGVDALLARKSLMAPKGIIVAHTARHGRPHFLPIFSKILDAYRNMISKWACATALDAYQYATRTTARVCAAS